MTVEAGRGAMGEERDEFPVGMRVLAVDDDPTCLKVLDAMLRQCKYHVTTTNQAIKALRMLRENKDKFDLIITDVHMPDMDGFKLLELVGLEMDLPVIMLSANGDTNVVMKGITHGACDYLLKPVRMEELKNIWQHVVRKKKSVPRKQNNSDNGTSAVGEQGPITSGSSEHKLNRKRKDQNEEDDDDNDENINENENTSSQKKARVVWSVELHRKFMAAVNHLGINKAVPKRILDLMNVEGLTRENVASHLQKYRLYLKKVANQEVNLVAALGGRDSYLPLAALDGFADFHSFTSSSQIPAVHSFPKNGGFNRKDSPVLGQNNSISHGIAQTVHTHNASNPISDLSKLQHVTGSQHGNLIQSMPTALGMDQLQHQKRMMQDSSNHFSSSFPAGGLGTGAFNDSIGTVTNSPLTLQATSIGLGPLCSAPFSVNSGVSSDFLDPVKFNEAWQSSMPSSGTASGLSMSCGVSPIVSQINCNPLSFSSSSTLVVPAIENTMLMLKGTNEDQKFLNFGSVGNTQQQWREAKEDLTHKPNIVCSSSLNPSLAGQSVVDSASHSQRFDNRMCSKRLVMNMNGQTNHSTTFLPQQCKIDKSIVDGQLNYKDAYSLENSTLQGGLSSNGYNFDELVNMIKSEREDADGVRGIYH